MSRVMIASGTIFLAFAVTACTDLPIFTPVSQVPAGAKPTDLNFDRIVPLAQAALDLTDCNLGRMSSDTLLEKYGATGSAERIRIGEVFYMVNLLADGSAQLIAFSGTTNAANNIYNLDDELVMDETIGGRVHAGYRTLVLAIREDLLPRLRRDIPVTLVGYSQGGAVAALLPLWLQKDGFTINQVITLGQPKVTDASLAGRLALLPVLRLVAGDDLVPAYPRTADYSHFGRSIELLDGPYITSLQPGDPGYDDPRELPSELPDFLIIDHGTYDPRLSSKVGTPVYEIPLEKIALD